MIDPSPEDTTNPLDTEAENNSIDNQLFEDLRPQSGDSFTTKQIPPTHDQETRKTLALIILWALVISHGIGFSAFAFGLLDNEKFTIFVTGFSGLQALAAAAVGFYYGSNQSD